MKYRFLSRRVQKSGEKIGEWAAATKEKKGEKEEGGKKIGWRRSIFLPLDPPPPPPLSISPSAFISLLFSFFDIYISPPLLPFLLLPAGGGRLPSSIHVCVVQYGTQPPKSEEEKGRRLPFAPSSSLHTQQAAIRRAGREGGREPQKAKPKGLLYSPLHTPFFRGCHTRAEIWVTAAAAAAAEGRTEKRAKLTSYTIFARRKVNPSNFPNEKNRHILAYF